MLSRKIATLLNAGLFSLLTVMTAHASPAKANVSHCGDLPAALTQDPLRAAGFQIVETDKLHRVQERPWAHIPTGAKILLRAPSGVTAADLHRAAMCRADSESPLSVPGAKLRVVRSGDLYELTITADQRSAALAIQHRTSAL